MNFNFFKTIYISLILNLLNIYSRIIRLFEYYSSYFLYSYYRNNFGNDNLVDSRFVDKKNIFVLFDQCSEIILKNNDDKKINIPDWKFNNVKNLAIVKPLDVNLNNIKKFCMLPSDVCFIEIKFFPWETDKKNILINFEKSYKINIE